MMFVLSDVGKQKTCIYDSYKHMCEAKLHTLGRAMGDLKVFRENSSYIIFKILLFTICIV